MGALNHKKCKRLFARKRSGRNIRGDQSKTSLIKPKNRTPVRRSSYLNRRSLSSLGAKRDRGIGPVSPLAHNRPAVAAFRELGI